MRVCDDFLARIARNEATLPGGGEVVVDVAGNVRLHEKRGRDIAEVQRLRLEKRVEGTRDIRRVGADRDAGATESVRALDDDRIAVRPAEGIRGCRVVDDRKRWHSDTHRR